MATLISNTTLSTYSTLPVDTLVKKGQTSTHDAEFALESITLTGYRVGTPGTITLNVYAVDVDHYPTGASLSSGSVDGDALTDTPAQFIVFTMSAATLSADTEYAMVVTLSDGVVGFDVLALRWEASDSYANGGTLLADVLDNWIFQTTDFQFSIAGTETGHTKATNPTPADTDTEVDFSTPTLSWDGTGDTYNVRGGAAGNFTLLASGISDTTYTLSTAQKVLFKEGVVTWRVDSILGEETLIGDDWTFDPRPGKAASPTPSNAGSDIETTTSFEWTLGTNGTTNELLIDGVSYLNSSAVTYAPSSDLFSWDDPVSWRVDTTNEYGTTTGDTWTFDALNLDHLRVTYTLIDGGSGNGPYDGGVEGTDFWYTGLNNVITLKRLVVVSKNRVFYEVFS